MGGAPPTAATTHRPGLQRLGGRAQILPDFLQQLLLLLVPLSCANEPAGDLLDGPALAGQLDSIRSSSLGEAAGVLLGHPDWAR